LQLCKKRAWRGSGRWYSQGSYHNEFPAMSTISVPPYLLPILLLFGSNIFMTVA
jgi:hypothetical protein